MWPYAILCATIKSQCRKPKVSWRPLGKLVKPGITQTASFKQRLIAVAVAAVITITIIIISSI